MRLGHSFSNAAQGLGLDAHVGGNIILGNALGNVGKLGQKGLVAPLGRVGVEGVDLVDSTHENLANGQPPKSFPLFNLLVKQVHIGLCNTIDGRVFQGLNVSPGGLLGEKAEVITNKFALFVKVAGFLLALDSGIIADQALFNKEDVFADLPCLQQMLAFPKVEWAK